MNQNNQELVTKKDLSEAIAGLEHRINQRLDKHEKLIEQNSQAIEKHDLTLEKHSQILEKHTQTLEKHSQILEKHTQTLEKHTQTLEKHSQAIDRLTSKIVDLEIKIETKLETKEESNAKFNRLVTMLDSITEKIDNITIEMKAQDHRTNRFNNTIQKEEERNDEQDLILDDHEQRISVIEKV